MIGYNLYIFLLLQNAVCKSMTTNMGSTFFWNVTSHYLVVGSWWSGPIFKGLNVQKNKVTHKPLKMKQKCHLKMSETNYPVTWNYISGQRPQLQECKNQKTYMSTNIAMMQNMWGYTHLHVQGNLKMWKIIKSTSSFLFCSVTGNMQFQIKWLRSKTKRGT